jgi:hypothetical protein
MGRPWLVAVWAGLGAMLAALLSVVSGLAVNAVPPSWHWAHNWVLLLGVTAGLVLAAVAVAVIQARSTGSGEQPGGPTVRVGKIHADTVIISVAAPAVPAPAQLVTTPAQLITTPAQLITAPSQPLDELIGATPPAPEPKRPPAAEPAGSKREKLTAYAPHWLIERLRNAVVALQRMAGAEADAPATLSELCQTACLREVQRLEAQYNDGAPFPARAKRKLRTGPPIQ